VRLDESSVPEQLRIERVGRPTARAAADWTASYLLQVVFIDGCCGLAAGLLAFRVRFGTAVSGDAAYFWFSLALPFLWMVALELAGSYDPRFIGIGSDEFRRVINAGVFLTAAVAIVSYATKTDVARGYIVIALPFMTVSDLALRFARRKRLHKDRAQGRCMRKAVIVGHSDLVGELATVLHRETYHGLSVVAACILGPGLPPAIEGVPVTSGIDEVGNLVDVARIHEADTVAVLACPEMIGPRLRELAWALEKTGTDLCVAPALLDVAGPRTTIRPVAGLPLLHMDHPEFTGTRWLIKSLFDRVAVILGLLILLPVFAVLALAIKLGDSGPIFFRQTRVGKDGSTFTLFKFRTMIVDAEKWKAELAARNDGDGLLFKMRDDPRITRVGRWLRRYSLDELPQLINVLIGDMSLVGPRPALPEEAVLYANHVRRRLAVKPGITGLWQVSGRSDLPWDEAVRLDVRYVENSSFVLDLQILWKTWSVVTRGDGAY
jgi:exopolysaccharide biosynthesis polyprenyl glycosylphosphotransferase